MMTPPLWHDAAAFSARAHRHQLRKDGRTPYSVHPARVALIIASVFGFTDDEIIAAGYLHDVIEDCDTDYDRIHEQFGKNVADYVTAMSKDMRMIEDEREMRYDQQLAAGPWQARLIKLADVYDNLSDVIDERSIPRLAAKAERALVLADGDEQLADAREKLRELVRKATQ